MTNIKLKPCPFCGEEAEIERIGTPRVSTQYRCTFCACSLETGEEWDHGSRWNQRPEEDRLHSALATARREALEEAARDCDEWAEANERVAPHERERIGAYRNAAASIRALLSQSVEVRVTGIELHCDDCQHSYAVWFAPNEIWNRVMGGQDCKGDPGGMLCPRCFTLRAEAAGFIPTAWEVRPGVVEVGPSSTGNGGADAS